MDILAISLAGGSTPLNNSGGGSSDGSFARTLEQAVGQQSTPATSAPAQSNSAAKSSSSDSTAAKASQAANSQTPTAQPQPDTDKQATSQAQPAQPAQQAASPAEDAKDVLAQQLPTPPAAEDVPPPQLTSQLAAAQPNLTTLPGTGSDKLDSTAAAGVAQLESLDEIRRRLALIEQAGKLPEDASANSGLAALAVAMQLQQAPAAQPVTSQSQGSSATEGAVTGKTGMTPATSLLETLAGNRQQTESTPEATSSPAAFLTANSGTTQNTATDSPPAALEQPLLEAVTNKPAHVAEPIPGQDFALTNPGTTASVMPGAATNPAAASQQPVVLSAPLGSGDWQQGLGQQLVGLYQRGDKQIDLHLHPADLGPLSISLRLADSGAQAQFISAHPQVRAAVEQALPELRAALASQGIALGEASVGSQQQPDREAQTNQSGNNGSRGPLVETVGEVSAQTGAAPGIPLRVSNGRVDLYA